MHLLRLRQGRRQEVVKEVLDQEVSNNVISALNHRERLKAGWAVFSARPALYLSGIHVHRKAIVTTHSPNTPELQTTPLAARIRLAHAYFQRIADMHSIDILHVKGYAFSQEIYRKGRYSSDADLLVRPSHVDRFVEILLADGWRIQATSKQALSSSMQ